VDGRRELSGQVRLPSRRRPSACQNAAPGLRRAAAQGIARQRGEQLPQQIAQDQFLAGQVMHRLAAQAPREGLHAPGIEELAGRPGERLADARQGPGEAGQFQQLQEFEYGQAKGVEALRVIQELTR
jgi:hypothetical protein